MTELKIGSTVWVFDQNRRVYDGHGFGARIIYREHFRPVEIIGETSKSWIIGYWNKKINKKTLEGIYTSEEEIDKMCWVHDHKNRIGRKLGRCYDYHILLQVAGVIGYDPEKDK